MSSIIGKLFTALRGGVNEAAEAAVDKQSIRILDQEMRDAEQALRQARADLAGIMATSKVLTRKVEESRQKESKDMAAAQNAINAGREDLALDLATRIANTRNDLQRDEQDLAKQVAAQQQMHRSIQETERRIAGMKREIENVKANESMLKAQSAIAHSQSGVNSRLGSAMDSLERIKQRQEHTSGRIEAGAELAALENGSDLDRRLAEAGIGGTNQSANDILAQLRGPAIQTQVTLPSPEKVAIEKQ